MEEGLPQTNVSQKGACVPRNLIQFLGKSNGISSIIVNRVLLIKNYAVFEINSAV